MMMSAVSILICVVFLTPFLSPALSLTLPNSISSNMVLQRSGARLWGWATPRTTVTVALPSIKYSTTVTNNGYWEMELKAGMPTSTNNTVIISGDGTSLTLENVAFGDVYLCGGQSNMELVLTDVFNASAEIADSGRYKDLRLYANNRTASYTPLNDTTSRLPGGAQWVVSAPQYLNGDHFTYFSALCYFYGRDIYRALNTSGQPVPIGLVLDVYGGTTVEAWSSPDALAKCPNTTNANQRANSVPTRPGRESEHRPTVLWFAMINPILPMIFNGIIWYQGESNNDDPINYRCRFPAMITDWRMKFRQPYVPFMFVLLAGYLEGGAHWAETRDAQLAALELNNTFVATAHDMGDRLNTIEGDIHSRNKSILGQRLANIALVELYARGGIAAYGPSISDIKFTDTSAVVSFDSQSYRNQRLRLSGAAECVACCNATGSPMAFVLSNNKVVTAAVSVDAESYTITASISSSSEQIIALQINFTPYPECVILNSADLPLLPATIKRVNYNQTVIIQSQ